MSLGLKAAAFGAVLTVSAEAGANEPKPVDMNPEYVEAVEPQRRSMGEIVADIKRIARERQLSLEAACMNALTTVREIVGCEVVKTVDEIASPNKQSEMACESIDPKSRAFAGYDILAPEILKRCEGVADGRLVSCIDTANRGAFEKEFNAREGGLKNLPTYSPAFGGRALGLGERACSTSPHGEILTDRPRCLPDDIAKTPDKAEVGMQGVVDHCSAAILKRLAELDRLREIQDRLVEFETAVDPNSEENIRTLMQMLEDVKK